MKIYPKTEEEVSQITIFFGGILSMALLWGWPMIVFNWEDITGYWAGFQWTETVLDASCTRIQPEQWRCHDLLIAKVSK